MNRTMKALTFKPLWASAALLAVALASRGGEQESEPPRDSFQIEFQPVESVFADDAREGIDPFFPNSKRREAKTPEPAPVPKGVASKRMLQSLKLKGVSGTRDRKIALINGRTFEVGEVAELRLPEGDVRIRCEAITYDSVVVSLVGEGVRQELLLNEPSLKLN